MSMNDAYHRFVADQQADQEEADAKERIRQANRADMRAELAPLDVL
ncbi:hypothetical protein [Streptomyces sp. CB01881]|nr:hypothetical protein [Streptomyces sp. CB01881]